MKKLSLLTVSLLFPLISAAQTPVFRCEVDGKVVWSDQPCKKKGTVVTVKPLKSGSPNTQDKAAPATPPKP